MERRDFIRTSGTALAVAGLLPSFGFSQLRNNHPKLLESFILNSFDSEQEEYPSIVTDGGDNIWMYSLRRLEYPENRELVSAFRFDGEKWVEEDPVTKEAGMYEAPAASCAAGGKPVVSWCSIESGQWKINVAEFGKKGFGKPFQFDSGSGKPINPVLFAASKERNWIAWEHYEKGKFSIHVSRFEDGAWSEPVVIKKDGESCYTPAMEVDKNGDLYLVYGVTSNVHQNIAMAIIDGTSLVIRQTVDVAVGGAFKDRINRNTYPAIAFDKNNTLWISYENNRHSSRLDDADCYTGDRTCSILSYKDGKIVEPLKTGKWLFRGKNDHKPTFFKDNRGNLFLATHCGGEMDGNPFWSYRLSWLDPAKGWVEPVRIFETSQKGVLIPPAMICDNKNNMWLSTCIEKTFKQKEPDIVQSRLTQLAAIRFEIPVLGSVVTTPQFKETRVVEHSPDITTQFQVSGHPKITGVERTIDGETYTLICGNLHEHSENSPCWPAGTDGNLHDDYRFGIHSEGYDFVALTDHGYSMTEVYWRKNIRIADFYNDPPYFIALPAFEWTLSARGELDKVFGAGHYNAIFATAEDASKFVRNEHEIYNVYTPETANSKLLWDFLDKEHIDCITIPHHPADEVHPLDWDVHNSKYVPVVELFQCRGNAEYPGCPREINLDRHRTTRFKRAFVDYALRDKKYQMGFVASGDHCGMGVGVAALWVKDVSREGILEAMRSKRCYATTGDKMILDFSVNGAINGTTISEGAPEIDVSVKGQRDLYKVEILRNSEVIREYYVNKNSLEFDLQFTDEDYQDEKEVLYYYARATQRNNEIAWSSPVWIENV